ncbi:MAG: retron St85 family RNA-directed DNA polymerase [Rhodoferax sp.]|uniref:retron St85 family RNA-directed DNA polymerase n=1 Tax=Rhodoferax sp. TaxID=50421 RepID=UPI002732B8CB|nr:retron St85 family RNA-directed DNA polymerase [Rhodoferax sp.]MDP2678576.1 retron St85 family RNA-directed DNA polymerase [Rhodoferax sp.]
MDEILQKIASDLLLPLDFVRHTVMHAPTRVKRFTIPKRTGGSREIIQPSIALKPILSWLDSELLTSLPVHPIATAFRPGQSILNNATAHSSSRYSVRVDISAFFPSIRQEDIKQVLLSCRDLLPGWASEPAGLALVSNVCFDRYGTLPIGYSTSPAIANAVMFQIDTRLAEIILKVADFGNAVLTRYADDFVFSTNTVGACNKFVTAISEVFAATRSPKFCINAAKTRFMSRAGGSTLVTGLRVNNLGNVVVHADYRDHVRLLLKLYKVGSLRVDEVPKLVGHLAYIQHVDPALFTKLSFKFFREIERIRGGHSPSLT